MGEKEYEKNRASNALVKSQSTDIITVDVAVCVCVLDF